MDATGSSLRRMSCAERGSVQQRHGARKADKIQYYRFPPSGPTAPPDTQSFLLRRLRSSLTPSPGERDRAAPGDSAKRSCRANAHNANCRSPPAGTAQKRRRKRPLALTGPRPPDGWVARHSPSMVILALMSGSAAFRPYDDRAPNCSCEYCISWRPSDPTGFFSTLERARAVQRRTSPTHSLHLCRSRPTRSIASALDLVVVDPPLAVDYSAWNDPTRLASGFELLSDSSC